MNDQHNHISIELLSDYLTGSLAEEQRIAIERHSLLCSDCKKEMERARAFLQKVESLPKEIQPPKDLWSGIKPRLAERKSETPVLDIRQVLQTKPSPDEVRRGIVERSAWYFRAAAIALVFMIGAAVVWYLNLPELPSWAVERLDGAPKVESETLKASGLLHLGEKLETDNNSRAKVQIGKIGEVTVEPNTKLRLLNTSAHDHRLLLEQGTISAVVSAPPRLFVVETPSAKAVDLGCAYTLSVDSNGASLLFVTVGWVSLEYGGLESIVPRGAECVTKSGFGPGTPFMKQSAGKLQDVLYRFDFEKGGETELDTILSRVAFYDALTLWHLISRVDIQQKEKVYDKLTSLVPTPEKVTREGVLKGDKEMMQLWQNHLGLNPYGIVSPVICVPLQQSDTTIPWNSSGTASAPKSNP